MVTACWIPGANSSESTNGVGRSRGLNLIPVGVGIRSTG
jgi:hypothetical protein